MNELKACPFCGRKPKVLPLNPEEEGNAWTAIVCKNKRCPTVGLDGNGVRVSHYAEKGHRATAIRKWNTRPPVAGLADASKDAERYRHRRFIEVTNSLSDSGVMAMSPELFQSALDDYDKQTDELKVIQIDFD